MMQADCHSRLGRRARRSVASAGLRVPALLLLLLHAAGCGYQSIPAAVATTRWCVLAAPGRIPDATAVAAALDGARSELARYGALGDANQQPCLHVELTRVRERPTGVVASPGAAGLAARGTVIEVTGRATVPTAPEAPPERDTGDLSREARLSQKPSVSADMYRFQQGTRAAARAVGIAMARAALGLPTPRDQPATNWAD